MEKLYSTFSEFSADYSYDEISDKLGEGGFATVYRADDLLRSRKVAIKVAKVPKNEKYSLMHEYEIVKTLPIHKNIVYYESCYRFKLTGLGIYDVAVMDYYQQGNLDYFMSRHPLTDTQFSALVEEILLGIEFLHQNRIIHRDIKPANILIGTQKGKFIPKIADFGLGKIKESTDESFTDNSFVGGTLNYAAPEQILGSKVKPNVDLWSFGVLLYKMCMGKVPFYVADTNTTGRREELTKKILQVDLPSAINQVEEPYQSIIRKCLVSDTNKRAKTATELISLLKSVEFEKTAIFVETPTPAKKAEPVKQANKPRKQVDSGSLTPYILLGITGILLLIFWFFTQIKSEAEPIETQPVAIPQPKDEIKAEKPAVKDTLSKLTDTIPVKADTVPLKKPKPRPKKGKGSQEGGSFIYDYELKTKKQP